MFCQVMNWDGMGWDGIYKAFRVVKVLFYKFVYVYVGDVSVFFLQ